MGVELAALDGDRTEINPQGFIDTLAPFVNGNSELSVKRLAYILIQYGEGLLAFLNKINTRSYDGKSFNGQIVSVHVDPEVKEGKQLKRSDEIVVLQVAINQPYDKNCRDIIDIIIALLDQKNNFVPKEEAGAIEPITLTVDDFIYLLNKLDTMFHAGASSAFTIGHGSVSLASRQASKALLWDLKQ